MYSPSKILTWLEENVQSMRHSRRKTLAAITSGAMRLQGCGVLALGRAMLGQTIAKHRIKRVDRFLGNEQVETHEVFSAVFQTLCPARGEVIVLADWTDRGAFQQLVFAVTRDGRALPFLCITVPKSTTAGEHTGEMVEAENQALAALESMCPDGVRPIIIDDRGFANRRWLSAIQNRGWGFVQRMRQDHGLVTESHFGTFKELGIRRGWRAREHGWGGVFEEYFGPVRAVSVFARDAKEPMYLVTNLEDKTPAQIVRCYQRRMWIEAMFRDMKNRNLGLGMDGVQLTTTARMTRHFVILALAYLLLCAFGAVAEKLKLADELKANTVHERVLSLARIGSYFIQIADCYKLNDAINILKAIPD